MSTLLRPRVSEKSMALATKNVYVFDVPSSTNKIEVARAVEKEFKVKVTKVNIIVHKGKIKTFKRVTGRQNDTKKAIVTLVKGQTIALFEGTK